MNQMKGVNKACGECGNGFGGRMDDERLCPQCRADLELGRLVRGMKPGDVLTHAARDDLSLPAKSWEAYSYVTEGGGCSIEATPEEALKGGKS